MDPEKIRHEYRALQQRAEAMTEQINALRLQATKLVALREYLYTKLSALAHFASAYQIELTENEEAPLDTDV